MSRSIVRMNPPTLPDAGRIGYSQISVVEPGRLAFISGQVAVRPGGEPVPPTLAEQAAIVASNARVALDAIGATPHDVVIARIYVVDLTPERLEEGMPAIFSAFDGAQPGITGIGVAALAAPELQIEMEMTVRLPD